MPKQTGRVKRLISRPMRHLKMCGKLALAAACLVAGCLSFVRPALGQAEPAEEDFFMTQSAIDRPDFKIRNIPYSPDPAPGRSIESPAAGELLNVSPGPGLEPPPAEVILAAVPDDLAARYLDRADFERRLTSLQLAEKYIGPAPEGMADSHAVQWMMMSDREQREAKIRWFRASGAALSLDEVGRFLDLRPYRVSTALNALPTPGLRKVEPPKSPLKEIEKLKMPELRPLKDWAPGPGLDITPPSIRPLGGDVALPEEIPAEEEAAGAGNIPGQFGIPNGLRNAP
ncbi:hypothetical protein HY522_04310 [bacterium]|nr:hypothetical protein [bacterium]